MINIKEFRKLKGWTQTRLAEYLKVSKSMISQVESGTVPYPDLWDHKLRDIMFSDVKVEEPIVKSEYFVNEPTTIKKYTSNIKFVEKDYRLVPLINRYAYASYSESWNDNEFIESMELLPTFHQEDGNYLWFEIKGDSMTRNEDPSLNEGDYVLGRELYNHHWMNLQLRRAKVWVINHRLQGLMVKEVVKQSNNVITCHSWNPIVAPFDLDLNEVNQLFYIKEVRKTNFF